MGSLAPGGQVGYVAVSWPVVELVDKDIEAPPGLLMVTDLCHSVPEPDFENLLVTLDGGDCALRVPGEGDPAW